MTFMLTICKNDQLLCKENKRIPLISEKNLLLDLANQFGRSEITEQGNE